MITDDNNNNDNNNTNQSNTNGNITPSTVHRSGSRVTSARSKIMLPKTWRGWAIPSRPSFRSITSPQPYWLYNYYTLRIDHNTNICALDRIQVRFACEGFDLKIQCHHGHSIHIMSAFYGIDRVAACSVEEQLHLAPCGDFFHTGRKVSSRNQT